MKGIQLILQLNKEDNKNNQTLKNELIDNGWLLLKENSIGGGDEIIFQYYFIKDTNEKAKNYTKSIIFEKSTTGELTRRETTFKDLMYSNEVRDKNFSYVCIPITNIIQQTILEEVAFKIHENKLNHITINY